MSCLSPFYRSALGVGYMHRISYYLARWLGAVLGCFFSVASAICLLYLFFFVAGVAHNTHTHIHINRTLANFFPDTLLTSGGFHPKPIYETNFAIFLVFFILGFAHGTHHFPRKYFQTFWQPPLTTPKRHQIYEPNSPKFL